MVWHIYFAWICSLACNEVNITLGLIKMYRKFLRLSIICLLLSPSLLFAVRPFVTDDARIADYGQIEVETWSEFSKSSHERDIAQNLMAGVTFTDWMQLISGSGIGIDKHGKSTVADFVIQPKFLILGAKEDGTPGVAFSTGITLPTGRGTLSSDDKSLFALGIFTSRLFDDLLQVHFNVGFNKTYYKYDNSHTKLQWGLGADVGIIDKDIRFIIEAYSGDPYESNTPDIAMQSGFRYLKSDYLAFDITFGAQPEMEHKKQNSKLEYWGQFGIRILFDAFTKKILGNPNGAKGMLQ